MIPKIYSTNNTARIFDHILQYFAHYIALATTTAPLPGTTTGISSTTATTITGAPTTSMSPTISTIPAVTGTTTKRCEEMQAIDEPTSRTIVVRPTDVPQEQKIAFQPTSTRGVSFPEDQRTPTIVVSFGRPAGVQSISIPRDRTPGANTQQFEVIFFRSDGSQINPTPIRSSTSPRDDPTRSAQLTVSEIPSTTPVSRLEIRVISTTDDRSPKGIILDIKACVEPITGSYLP